MSVLAEAISVVVLLKVLDHKYPGGATQYERDCPNGTYCADEHLSRVGFMTPGDARDFVEGLARLGFVHLRDGKALDLVVVDQVHGPTTPCDWLQGGKHPDGYSAVWLAGTVPGLLAHPPGWTPQQSAQMHFMAMGEGDDRFLHLGQRGELDTMIEFKSGKEVYIGRTSREKPAR